MKICKKGISVSLAVIVLLTACAGRMKSLRQIPLRRWRSR